MTNDDRSGDSIAFYNPGDFDLRGLTTFGLSGGKTVPNPIGLKGTGLKFAIAGVLRLGGSVEILGLGIENEKGHWQVCREDGTFRGHKIETLTLREMNNGVSLTLPFTPELGANWEPWMIYREFLSNALDEGGGLAKLPLDVPPGTCFIIRNCPALVEVDAAMVRPAFNVPIITTESVRGYLLSDTTSYLYYRGIRATPDEDTHRKWIYHWDVTELTDLTEDRFFRSQYSVRAKIRDALVSAGTAGMWELTFGVDGEGVSGESIIDFSDCKASPNDAFFAFWLRRVKNRKGVPYGVKKLLEKWAPDRVKKAENFQQEIVPVDWVAAEYGEPEYRENKESHYTWYTANDLEIESLKDQITYWKSVALGLARNAGLEGLPEEPEAEAAAPTPPPVDDEILY